MRVTNICIALFASISATFTAAREVDVVEKPTEFRLLRGQKHSAKRNKSTSKKSGDKSLSYSTSGDINTKSSISDAASCPEKSPDADTLCSIVGQLCIFTYDTTFPGGSSTARDECTCTNGKWICEATIASSAIAMIGCPAESPLVTKDIICDAESVYPTPCTFEYITTQSSAICTNKDECMCNGGNWACFPSISCITTDTSNVVDSCPEESPIRIDADAPCDKEGQLCTYTNDTIFPGGSSTSREECTCTSGKWFCEGTAASGLSARVCPSESPVVTENMICDEEDGALPTPCTFEYKSSPPDAICSNKDECFCNSGKWDCYTAVGCVSAKLSAVGSATP